MVATKLSDIALPKCAGRFVLVANWTDCPRSGCYLGKVKRYESFDHDDPGETVQCDTCHGTSRVMEYYWSEVR